MAVAVRHVEDVSTLVIQTALNPVPRYLRIRNPGSPRGPLHPRSHFSEASSGARAKVSRAGLCRLLLNSAPKSRGIVLSDSKKNQLQYFMKSSM